MIMKKIWIQSECKQVQKKRNNKKLASDNRSTLQESLQISVVSSCLLFYDCCVCVFAGEEGKMAHRHVEQDGVSRLFAPGSMASTAF